jgi:8-oxo-dGTP pyrophosphatase MutT (NUDIX family)
VIAQPRPASTVCLVRDGDAGLEVLMVRRGRTARFMGGAWVFPGGVVDPVDGGEGARAVMSGAVAPLDLPWVAAGLRELVEEVGIWLTVEPLEALPTARLRDADVYEEALRRGARFDAGGLAYFSNWITPAMIPVRFDTRFYAAIANGEHIPDPDPAELEAAEWVAPSEVLEQARAAERTVPLPTVMTLEQIGAFSTADAFLAFARDRDEVPAVLPRARVGDGGRVRVVLPGEPGYDELGDAPPDPGTLSGAARAAAARGHLAEVADHEG